MKKISVLLACGSALAIMLLLASACSEDVAQQPCRDIPDGGCPAQDNACEDPTCFTLYDCSQTNTWTVDMVCPAKTPFDAGDIFTDGGADANEAVDGAAYLDVPGALGGPGCEDLEAPDCSLGSAAVCSDCCGCDDLYVCQNGGWVSWGECVNGQIEASDGGS